tara:strand:- start:3579 stop:4571 length:993 start_codon:yes stop_codon:yes gene_type:complete
MTAVISIVTPCFNPGSLILELEESLVAQGLTEIEWVIVDDGSDQETLDFLLEIESRSELRARVIRGSNQGACHARNVGFKLSHGRWVKFVDADDILEPGHLREQLELATVSPTAVIVSPKHDFYDSVDEKRIERYSGVNVSELEDPFRRMLVAAPFHHSSALYPRSLVEAIGGWDESLAADQDGDFLLRLLLLRPKLVWCDGAGFLFRQHSYTNRITMNDNPRKWESRFYVCSKIETQLSQAGLLDAYRNELALRYDRIAKRALTGGGSDEVISKALNSAGELSSVYLKLEPKYVRILRTFLGFKRAELLRSSVEKNRCWKRIRYGIRSV